LKKEILKITLSKSINTKNTKTDILTYARVGGGAAARPVQKLNLKERNQKIDDYTHSRN